MSDKSKGSKATRQTAAPAAKGDQTQITPAVKQARTQLHRRTERERKKAMLAHHKAVKVADREYARQIAKIRRNEVRHSRTIDSMAKLMAKFESKLK